MTVFAMKVLDPGHDYLLNTLDGGELVRLRFVKRDRPKEKYPGNVGEHPGTNCQEVMRALIDRLLYLDWQVPCMENTRCVAALRECIILLEHRAARRHGRELSLAVLRTAFEALPTCTTCGHVECREHVQSNPLQRR